MSGESGRVIPPGGTIGILGGGQLGRMTALAAARLGYRCHVYSPEEDSPAAQVSDRVSVAGFLDDEALDRFADAVDVVTWEFENVPTAAARRIHTRGVPVRPGERALDVSRDRVAEKTFLAGCGVPTVRWADVPVAGDLAAAVDRIGRPCLLKAARGGYDGKGQVRIEGDTDPDDAWRAMGAPRGVVEALADFACEISVVLARGVDGAIELYDAVENRHVRGILDTTVAPAAVAAETAAQARAIAGTIALGLDLVGLLAVEMFVLADGTVLVNEIAPRPHNSGHWTIDACVTSQFEQHVRAVCGLPLGTPERHSDAEMENLLGDAVAGWPRYLAEPATKLHLYGKSEIRPGRKMGHVTRLKPRSAP